MTSHLLRSVSLTALVIMGTASASLADDHTLEPASFGSWSGAYIGVHAGFGAFTGQARDWDDEVFSFPDGDIDLNAFAALGGIQAGYSGQVGTIVYGLEADASWTGFSEDRFFQGDNRYVSAEMDWMATLRARLGVTAGNAMAYVTGGLALAHPSHCANHGFGATANPCSTDGVENLAWDDVSLGFVAGAGVEAALKERWSLKAEYLFTQMNQENVVYNTTQDWDIDFSNRSHQVRIGLNYHFDTLPTAPNPDEEVGSWTGLYGGLHAGVGSFRGRALDWDTAINPSPSGDLDLNAFAALGGIQAGYNHQVGNVIYGMEADLSWTGFDEDRVVNGDNRYVRAETDWLSTVRGRLGLASGNAMAYVTGGLAVAHLSHCANFDQSNPCSTDGSDDVAWDGTQLGLLAGAGVEAALSERWSLKGEYLFVQMAHGNVVYNATNGDDIDFSNRSHQVRLGLNYHFDALPTAPLIEDDLASWSGLYAGVHAGGGAFTGQTMDWGRDAVQRPDGDLDLNAFAGLGGIQVGYNRPVGSIVYGLEADASWTGFSEERFYSPETSYAEAEMDWLSTLRGRLGLASGNAMAYVTGGLAVAHLSHCANGSDGLVPAVPCSVDNERNITWEDVTFGLAAGAGAEVRLT